TSWADSVFERALVLLSRAHGGAGCSILKPVSICHIGRAMTTPHSARPRLMLLFTTTGYEAREFVQAARQLGVDTVLGSDRCHVLDDPWQDGALPLRFEKPHEAAQHILDYARAQPLDAILPIGDPPVLTAALANQALGLWHNDPDAAAVSRNKFRMRQRLHAAGLRVPWFACFPMRADPRVL